MERIILHMKGILDSYRYLILMCITCTFFEVFLAMFKGEFYAQ